MKYANTCLTLPLDAKTDIYTYAITPLVDTTYLALRSDDKITAFNVDSAGPQHLWTFPTGHSGASQVLTKQIQGQNSEFLITGGSDGCIRCWDARVIDNQPDAARPIQSLRHSTNSSAAAPAILSLASHPSSTIIAAGTELAGPGSDASVQFWDLRQPRDILHKYTESHSDDIIALHYHPFVSDPSILLSGSTDGLVNIYNSTVRDEDDAVLQVFNHGAGIHHAGFLTDDVVYALSSDEQFSLYQLGDPNGENVSTQGDDEEGPMVCAFGDIRQVLDCDYVIDMVGTHNGPVICAGSFSQNRLDLVPLRRTPAWDLRRDESIRLVKGLGDELVRSVFIDHVNEQVIAGSEDSIIRVWSQFS